MKVVFSTDMDKTTFAGITITNQGSAAAPGGLTYDLAADNRTLTITTTNALTKNGYYRVDMNNVQDISKNTLNPYSIILLVNDTTAPTVSKTEGITSGSSTMTFKIFFSEPVMLDMVKVGTVVAGATPNATYGDIYTVTLPSTADALVVGKSYDVTISGLRDYASNYASTTINTSVLIAQDAVKPNFTVNAISPTQFSVVFSEDMDTTAVIPVDAITVKDTTTAKNILPLGSLPAWKTGDKRTLMCTLAATPIATGQTSANVTVTVQNLADLAGNKVATTDASLTLSKETVKPTINSVRFVPTKNDQIEVTFSEFVTGIAGTDFILTASDKTTAGGAISVGVLDANNKLILTLGTPVAKTDTYTLALVVNSVTDASANTNDAVAKTLSYTAPAAPQLTATITSTTNNVTAIDSIAANRIAYIKFNQTDVINGINNVTGSYKDGAADNPANFTINGAALPVGTVVTFVNNDGANAGNDAVKLDLSAVTGTNIPEGFLNGGNAVITVSNVKTDTGSTAMYSSAQITIADKTKPTIKSAYLTGNDTVGYTITLVMSEKMSTAPIGDFALSVGGAVAIDTCTIVSTDATKVEIKVTTPAQVALIKAAPATLTVSTIGAPTAVDLNTNTLTVATNMAVTNYSN